MPSEDNDLLLRDIKFCYPDGFAISGINLAINSGQTVCLLGPNGSGKTTLLKIASGVLAPWSGEVLVGGQSIGKMSRKAVAQRIAVVPQQFNVPFAYTVEEIALLGRTPYAQGLGADGRHDREVAAGALGLTGMTSFGDRFFNDLSGGEKQKAVLAMALTQEPKLLLLDEPTAHLDINHQVEILELLRKLNREQTMTMVAVMHDINLAALYFERLVLINQGSIMADGTPAEVVTKEIIQKVFAASVEVSQHPNIAAPQIVIVPHDHR